MDKTPEEIEAIYAGFEELGEEKVRMYRETGKYGEASGNMALSKLWLEQKDLEIPWYEAWWAKPTLAVLVIVLAAVVIAVLGLG